MRDPFEVLKCVLCGGTVIQYKGQWLAYPLVHGKGSAPHMRMKEVCFYKWGLFARPHRVESVYEDEA